MPPRVRRRFAGTSRWPKKVQTLVLIVFTFTRDLLKVIRLPQISGYMNSSIRETIDTNVVARTGM